MRWVKWRAQRSCCTNVPQMLRAQIGQGLDLHILAGHFVTLHHLPRTSFQKGDIQLFCHLIEYLIPNHLTSKYAIWRWIFLKKNPKSTSFQFWSWLVVVPPVRSAQTTMSTFAFPNISGLKRLLNKDALGTQETSQNFLLRRFWLCIMMAGSYCPPCLYPPAFGKLPPLSDMVRSGWIATAWCSQPQIREGE